MRNKKIIKTVLQEKFGFDRFRPLQEEIINDVLGGGNRFVILPTGGGKSLAYLLPAHILGGLTLVVSPLIALMDDQLRSAQSCGLRATIWSNELDFAELQIVFVSPEKLFSYKAMRKIKELKLAHFVIDEAHCVVGWGSSFRPFYGLLKDIIETIKPSAISLFSATVRESKREEIVGKLGLQKVVNFNGGFDRPNIFFHRVYSELPEIYLARLLNKINGKAIVYCGSRKKVEDLSLFLVKYGFEVAPYHAGMRREQRMVLQERFKKGGFNILCATSAFGMGIDIPDIRIVVHLQSPSNLEEYYQEAGRAGRDGKKAVALLLIRSDWEKQGRIEPMSKFILKHKANLPDLKMDEKQFVAKLEKLAKGRYPAQSLYAFLLYHEVYYRRIDESKIVVFCAEDWQKKLQKGYRFETVDSTFSKKGVSQFIKKSGCRRSSILRFFNEEIMQCGGCDFCGSAYSSLLQIVKEQVERTIKIIKKLENYSISEQKKIINQSETSSKQKILFEKGIRLFRKIV